MHEDRNKLSQLACMEESVAGGEEEEGEGGGEEWVGEGRGGRRQQRKGEVC